MKFLNVMAKKEFMKDGESVVLWNKVGIIKQTNTGMWYLQLFHQPETDFYVFGTKDQEQPIIDSTQD